MSQKQSKRLRRMEREINTLHDAHYSAAVRIARIEEQFYRKPQPSPWQRLQKLFHKSGR